MARVLVVGNGPPARGGIPSFIVSLLESELSTRHDVRFLNLSATDAGGRVRRLSAANVRRTLHDALGVWRSAAGCDVVHLHTSLGPVSTTARAGLLALVARLRRARVLLHAHGGYVELAMRSRWRRATMATLLAPVDIIVTVAEATRASIAKELPRTTVVQVDNGIHVDRFRSATRDRVAGPPRVLYAGFLTPRKGVLDLFAASTVLLEEGIDHELVIVGGAAEDEATSEDLVRAGAPSHVTFLGQVDATAMPALYANADIYCLPSWWEAMPMSILEAMAAGLPVVATAVGDVPRLVIDGTTGLLVPPRDPGALAGALRVLLAEPARRRSMGTTGARVACERWDITSTVDAVDALIVQLTGREEPRSPGQA